MDIICVKLDRSVYVIIPENNIYRRCLSAEISLSQLSARRLTVKTCHRKEVKVFSQIPVVGFSLPQKRSKIVGVDIFTISY